MVEMKYFSAFVLDSTDCNLLKEETEMKNKAYQNVKERKSFIC